VIIDASVAFKWLVEESDSDQAIRWIGAGASLLAPTLILAETGHALTKCIRRGELSAEGAGDRFARLTTLLTLFDDTPFMARAFDLSIALRHGFYDCVYLAAAEALGDRLLTADAVFVGKVADHALRGSVLLLGAKP
jgi:predicted nucleic acid-binding protein